MKHDDDDDDDDDEKSLIYIHTYNVLMNFKPRIQ